MEHEHRLHHRAVAAARRNAPSPAPALYNVLARDGPVSLPFPTDPIPPLLGQAPSSLIAPFLPSVIPTINPLSGILPTTPATPAPSKPTTGLSANTDTTLTPVEIHTPSSVLNTTSSPVSHGTISTTSSTTTSGHSLPPQVPAVVTQVVPPSSSTSALNNNTSTSQTSGATTNSGTVAAGVVVGLVGACAMVVFLVFLVRRKLSKSHDDFDATDFRRSAVLIHDPPAHEDVVARGYKPRPPSMIERKMANSPSIPAVTPGNMYNAPPEGYNTASGPYNQTMFAGGKLSNSSDGSHTQVLFAGGQLMNPFVSAPPSPGSFATAGHSQSSNGVVTRNAPYIMKSTPPSPRRTSRPATGNDPGAANGFTFPQRQGSRPGTAECQQEHDMIPEQVPSDDYIDLSRSSVSPFQAAQYEAISRKLATDVPRGLDNVDVTSIMAPSSLEYIDEAPPVPPKSPFEGLGFAWAIEPSTESADDAPPPVPSKSPFEDPAPEHEMENIRESYASHQTLPDTPQLQDFPVPPSPALTLTSRYRVDSLPPTLPELKLDFGTQALNTIKGKNAVPKYSSSPLVANNTMGDEVEEAGMLSQTNVPPVLSTAEVANKSRPDTVYDPADAYGGI